MGQEHPRHLPGVSAEELHEIEAGVLVESGANALESAAVAYHRYLEVLARVKDSRAEEVQTALEEMYAAMNLLSEADKAKAKSRGQKRLRRAGDRGK